MIISFIPAQSQDKLSFFEAADTLHKGRFWTCAATGVGIYGSVSVGLYYIWYKNYDQSKFHFFNDWGEWQQMDKIGHSHTAYNYSILIFKGARWTGIKRRKAMWTTVGISTLLQTTIETMDGFSEEWGFSMYDIGFNTAGIGLFAAQEMIWQEQRITLKVSNSPVNYPSDVVYSDDGFHSKTLAQRADDLYGATYAESFLKDYNAQTLWLSFNIQSFMKNKKTKFPKWLNVAVGYSGENMFEGHPDYRWEEDGEDGNKIYYSRDPAAFPRYRQYFLSLDIDLNRIPTKSPFLKTLFNFLNFLKIPAPALELNSLGNFKFHPAYF